MSQLQKLLDEKYPISSLGLDEQTHIFSLRQSFTEGYNAAMRERDERDESDKRQALHYLNSRKPIDDTKSF